MTNRPASSTSYSHSTPPRHDAVGPAGARQRIQVHSPTSERPRRPESGGLPASRGIARAPAQPSTRKAAVRYLQLWRLRESS